MKRLVLLFLCFQIPIFSVDYKVEEKEIKTKRKVSFINYKGKRKRVDRRKAIIGIGRRLASIRGKVKNVGNYSILHIIGKKGNKFDADIFIVKKTSKVDHIKNIRRVIAGYLSKAYNYSYEEAYTIATFLTYYNAIYRGNVKYFASKYKEEVVKKINERNAGIDLNYKNWPGKTRMLIPIVPCIERRRVFLSEPSGRRVIEELRKKKDKGIPEREKMLRIKERELKKIKKEIRNKEHELKGEKDELERNRKRKKLLIKEIESLKKKPWNQNVRNEMKKKKKELEKVEQEIKKGKTKIKKAEAKIKETKSMIKGMEEEIKKEKDEIKKDKKLIAKIEEIKKNPEKTLKKIERLEKELQQKRSLIDKNIYKDTFYYLKRLRFTTGGFYDSQMIAIDAMMRKIIARSPLNIITGEEFSVTPEGILVIARESEKSNRHLLTLLDKEELKPIKISKKEVFVRSFIRVDDDFVFCIVKDDNNKFYLGKFDKDLKLVKKTNKEIDPNSAISIYKNMIYINSKEKEIFVFDKDTLKFIDEIKP